MEEDKTPLSQIKVQRKFEITQRNMKTEILKVKNYTQKKECW